jgi:hypothetical protein
MCSDLDPRMKKRSTILCASEKDLSVGRINGFFKKKLVVHQSFIMNADQEAE